MANDVVRCIDFLTKIHQRVAADKFIKQIVAESPGLDTVAWQSGSKSERTLCCVTVPDVIKAHLELEDDTDYVMVRIADYTCADGKLRSVFEIGRTKPRKRDTNELDELMKKFEELKKRSEDLNAQSDPNEAAAGCSNQ
jgi:hypothetical protein